MSSTRVATGIVIFCLFILSCRHQAYVIPVSERTGVPGMCFDRDILPIFLADCATGGCHDAKSHKRGYVLDNYENIVKKGVAPGNALGTRLYTAVLGYAEQRMPQDQPPLSAKKIDLMKRWIEGGALKDNDCAAPCDSNNFSYSLAIQPLIEKYCVVCHSGTTPSGSLILGSYVSLKDAVQNRNLIKSINYTPGYKAMPQGLKLSDCEIRQVEKWVAANMPNN